VFEAVDQQQAVDLRRVLHRAMGDRREGRSAVSIGGHRDGFARFGGCGQGVTHCCVVHRGVIHRRMVHRRMVHLRMIHRRMVHFRMIDRIDLFGRRSCGLRRWLHRAHVMSGMRLRERRQRGSQAQGQHAGGKQ